MSFNLFSEGFAKKEGWDSADNVSQALSHLPEIDEKKMFVSLAYVTGGNDVCQQVLIE